MAHLQNGVPVASNNVIPGTTISSKAEHDHLGDDTSTVHTLLGPSVDDTPTLLSLYSPAQLAKLAPIPVLIPMINDAFRHQHTSSHPGGRLMPASIDRLPRQEDYFLQVGNDFGTFVYILTLENETHDPIATIAAHRYTVPVFVATEIASMDPELLARRTAFTRMQVPAGAEGAEMWELKLLVVKLGYQRRGLADYLIRKAEEEIQRRFLAQKKADGKGDRRLCIVLTTVKEANHVFYQRRGYVDDYETRHEKGFMGSETGFVVVHMHKMIHVEDS